MYQVMKTVLRRLLMTIFRFERENERSKIIISQRQREKHSITENGSIVRILCSGKRRNMKKVKAYKVFDENMQCRGFQYKLGESYTIEGNLEVCSNGFHACEKLLDCFNYYSFSPRNKIALVILSGEIQKKEDKLCAETIQIKKMISWEEALKMCNSGDYNSGYRNSGDYNSGNRNSGYLNSNNSDKIRVFNKWIDSSIEIDFPDFFYFNLTVFISHDTATSEEKEKYKKEIETCGGFLKTLEYKEAWRLSYEKASDADKAKVKNIPGFDSDIFYEITGIRI